MQEIKVVFHFAHDAGAVTYLMGMNTAESLLYASYRYPCETFTAKRRVHGNWREVTDTVVFINVVYIEWPLEFAKQINTEEDDADANE